MVNSLRLAARSFWREWMSGQWTVVFFALVIAVASVTTLDFYTDRLKRGIENNNATFLGGDFIIKSTTPIPQKWVKKAERLQLRTTQVWSYPSVVTTLTHKMQLVNLEAVAENYPLLGDEGRPTKKTVWIEPRLFSLLSIKEHDALMIGAAQFSVDKPLQTGNSLPDSGWSIAPRVRILLADVPATETVLPGSRVDYQLFVIGEPDTIQQFKTWLLPKLSADQRVVDVKNSEERLTSIISQVENFLQLALLVCLAMCSTAIVLSIQRYLQKHYSYTALWRSLGASQSQILGHYLYKLIFVTMVAGLLGVLLGYGAQHILAHLFQEYMQIVLPVAGSKPIYFGLLISVTLLFVFAYPVIRVLPSISPLYIWRREVSILQKQNTLYFIFAFLTLAGLVYALTEFSGLTLLFLNFIALCVAFFYALSLLLLAVLKKMLPHAKGVMRRGLSQLTQYADNTSLQFISFTLAFMLVLVLGMVRAHLLQYWQQSFSNQTPNYFAINIAPEDLRDLSALFKENNIALSGLYPMVRGRLVALNGQPIMQAVPSNARDHNALHRELNLTWMQKIPADNRMVQGDAWPEKNKNGTWISVEKKLAEDLKFKLGDSLTFQVGEKVILATIKNFRTVSWASFHPNFFVIFSPGIINHFAATYITSFHLAATQSEFLNQLIEEFPNVTIIDVASLLQQVQNIIGKITYASQYLLIFTLIAALLVFVASLQANMDERRNAYRLWKMLGASKRYVRQSMAIELGSILLVASFSAYFFATLFVYLIEMKVFEK